MNRSEHPWRAAAWMGGAILCFTAMTVSGRAVLDELSPLQLLAWRSMIGFLTVALWVGWRGGGSAAIHSRVPLLHLGRNLVHFAAQNFWFHAIALVSLAEVVALEFTNPLWVALLAPLFLGERMTVTRALAAIGGFAGVLLVTQPGVQPLTPGHWAGLAAGLGFAFVALFTRRITATDRTATLLFWMLLLHSAFALALTLPSGLPLPSQSLWPATLVLSLSGLVAHLCLTQALALAPAIIVGPMDFLRLPLTAIAALIFFDEPLSPMVLAGGALIVAANAINLLPRRNPASE